MPSSVSMSDDDDKMPFPETSPTRQASSSDSNDDHEGSEDNASEEEEEEEEEEEGDDNIEEDESADSSSGGSPTPVPDDDTSGDTSQGVESDKNDDDPSATSITLEKSNGSVLSHGEEIGCCGGDLPTVNHSNELAEKQCREVLYVDCRDRKPTISEISLGSSEENRLLVSPLKTIIQVPMLEKRMFTEASYNVQNDVSEVHNGIQNDGSSVGAESTKLSSVKEDEIAVENLCKDGSCDREPGGIPSSETEMKHMHMETDVQSAEDFKLNTSSSHTQQRPRSLTPDAELGNTSKRPAVLCDFFARGWCIKGNSCRFLHQKVGVDNAGQLTKGYLAGEELVERDNAGLRPAAETSRMFHEGGRLPSFPREDLSFGIMQRIESGQPEIFQGNARVASGNPREAFFPDCYNNSLIVREDFKKIDTSGKGLSFRIPSFHEKISPPFTFMVDRGLVNQEINSRNYPEAVKTRHEIPKEEHLNDELFAGGYPLFIPRHNSAPGCRPFSSGLSIPSSIYGIDNITKSTVLKQQNKMSLPDACHAVDSLKTSFSTSLQSAYISPSHPGTTSSTRGSNTLSAERLSAQNLIDSDKGLYIVSRSASLPRSSSPYYSRHGSEDPTISAGTKLSCSYDWEPSVPFRSSFYCSPASISSPGSQYDPLVDSIEPLNGESRPIQASTFSQEIHSQNITHHQPNGEPFSARICSPEYIAEKLPHSFHESHEDSFNKNVYKLGITGYTIEAGSTGKNHVTDGETIGSMPKLEKTLSDHPHIVGSTNVNEVDFDGSSRHKMEKSKHSKDSKAMKLFYAALVDFVKELVKPSWREGHLSKDAHKMIVKKAVDKVLSTLRSHQIPNTAESIKQYLSSSRPKLAKLVEGYVDKYVKS